MFETREKRMESACRILLTLQLIFAIRGYIILLQTEYQLTSPLIPKSIIYDISHPYVITSLITGGMTLIALWFYFLNKKTASVVVAGASMLLSQVWFYVLVK